MSPKMIAKTVNLLLKFPEAAFNPETAAVQANNRLRGQIQTGAYKNALRIPILHKYESAENTLPILTSQRSLRRI